MLSSHVFTGDGRSGATVWLAGLNPGVLEVVRRSGLADRLGRDRMLFNARAAIERYQALPSEASGAGTATRQALRTRTE